jgi:tetratricopeptide (TPR) repeat protein
MTLQEALQRREYARQHLGAVLSALSTARDSTTYNHYLNQIRQLIEYDPGYFESHFQLGAAYQMAGAVDHAQHEFETAIRCDPAVGGNSANAYRVYAFLTDRALRSGQGMEALKWGSRFLVAYPLSPESASMAHQMSAIAQCPVTWFQYYQMGCQYQQAGQHQEACTYFSYSSQQYHAMACTYVSSAQSLRALGHYAEAIKALDYSLTLDQNPHVMAELGMLHGLMKFPHMEERHLKRALEIAPGDPFVQFRMGLNLLTRSERREASEYLQRAMETSPDAAWAGEASNALAQITAQSFDGMPQWLELPIEWVRWELKDEGISVPMPSQTAKLPGKDANDLLIYVDRPSRPSLWFRLRRLQSPPTIEIDSFCRVREAYEVRKTPGIVIETRQRTVVSGYDAEIWEMLNPQTAEHTMMALVFRAHEVYELRGRSPGDAWRCTRRVFQHVIENSRIANDAEKYQTLKFRYQKVVERDPQNLTALEGLAEASLAMGQSAEAVALYNKLLKIKPNHPPAIRGLAQCQFTEEDYDGSIRTLEALAQNKPELETWLMLADAYTARGKTDRALRAVNAALQLSQKDAKLHLRAAHLNEEMKKLREAEQEFQTALNLAPDEVAGRIDLGFLYRKQKRFDDAISVFKQALRLDPGHLNASLLLAICYTEGNYLDSAEKLFKEILMANKGLDAAREGLREVENRRKSTRSRG